MTKQDKINLAIINLFEGMLTYDTLDTLITKLTLLKKLMEDNG